MSNKRFLIVLNILACSAVILLAWKYVGYPEFVKYSYKDTYQELMFQCDNVMRDHLIAKNRVIHQKTEAAIELLEAAEIGLMSCHEYDKLRKKMLVAGVTNEELSMMGLEAIEANIVDIKEYVKIHEFKY